VTAVQGSATVESVTLRAKDGHIEDVSCSAVYVMIGADPCTEASEGCWLSMTRAIYFAATARLTAPATSAGR